MQKSKLNPLAESKLSKTVANIIKEKPIEKSRIITLSNNKTTHYKIKTFRLRQLDAENLIKIVKESIIIIIEKYIQILKLLEV